MDDKMFCFQCEQTAGGFGCTKMAGVCGKTAANAKLQDEGLFTTVTNVNFNDETLVELIKRVREEKDRIAPGCAGCQSKCGNTDDYEMSRIWEAEEDIRSLKSLILFGIRGMAAYAYHAMVLGYTSERVNGEPGMHGAA